MKILAQNQYTQRKKTTKRKKVKCKKQGTDMSSISSNMAQTVCIQIKLQETKFTGRFFSLAPYGAQSSATQPVVRE